MELSYQSMKIAHQAREADELKTEMRRKSLLVLIYHHLLGFVAAAVALDQETNGSVRKFKVCDNIDLEMMLLEYESYHYVKFQKYPKLIRKTEPGSESGSSVAPESSEFGLNVSSIKNGPAGEASTNRKDTCVCPFVTDIFHMRLSLCLCLPLKDIYLHSPSVRWEDIVGLEDAKRLVKEAVVYPIKYPQLFTGILSSWKGLLLYGPPGTGKTLLAKAVATECKTTFFNISASSIVSKWRGDSEKLVRVLFELARYHAPSTIFLDELESVMGQRGSNMGELDHAMLRRLEKRILVSLPSSLARQAMISHWLPPLSSSGGVELRTELDYETLAKEMEGYSGSDMRLVCKEAAMRPVRKIFSALESHQHEETDLPAIQLGTVTTADFLDVIAHTKPSARNLMDRYTAWEKEYESV
uniref:Katanin p60 ATPase-containing subunit A-like 2 n=1 Tax=Monopterus albus TaxID=43700 RepID=A0A3Q3IV33_MONAL